LNGIHYFKNAYGHPVIIDSYPKQFQSLEESPDKVIVFFSEAIVLQYSQISVIDSEGNRVDDGKAENYNGDTSTITTNIKEDLPEGTYTINTKVLSAVDGHVVDNSVVFSVGEGVSGIGEETRAKSKSIFELISFDNSLSRVPGYVGQIIIIGAPLIFLWIQKPLSQFTHNLLILGHK
jgi:copper transport protein